MRFSHPTFALAVLSLLALSACSGADSATGNGGGGGAGTTTTTTDPIEPLTACVDDDIMDSFSGPGYDASKGGLQPPVQASYVAATTVLLQSSDPAKQMLFGQLFPPVLADAQKAPGFVGLQLGLSSKCHYARTLTLWTDMASMMTFVASANHANAMANASKVSDAGATTHWNIDSSAVPPTWADARAEILKMGTPAY